MNSILRALIFFALLRGVSLQARCQLGAYIYAAPDLHTILGMTDREILERTPDNVPAAINELFATWERKVGGSDPALKQIKAATSYRVDNQYFSGDKWATDVGHLSAVFSEMCARRLGQANAKNKMSRALFPDSPGGMDDYFSRGNFSDLANGIKFSGGAVAAGEKNPAIVLTPNGSDFNFQVGPSTYEVTAANAPDLHAELTLLKRSHNGLLKLNPQLGDRVWLHQLMTSFVTKNVTRTYENLSANQQVAFDRANAAVAAFQGDIRQRRLFPTSTGSTAHTALKYYYQVLKAMEPLVLNQP